MAVTKLWPVMVNLKHVIDYAANPEKTDASIKRTYTDEQYQALADVLTYAKNEEKTEREFYVEGINCNPSTARDQFIDVKRQFNKTDGIQAYHGYISFKEQNITPEMAQKIGMEFAREVWGDRFQIVVTTHLNTTHLHCHFVINSVSFKDGYRCQDTSWFKFRHVADRICDKYKLYYNPQPQRSKQNSYYYKQEKAGMPTRYSIAREAIDEALSNSTNLAMFKSELKKMGYAYNLSENRKYWTVTPKGYNKPIRLKNLGEEYTNDAIVKRLAKNRNDLNMVTIQYRTYKPRQYNLQTRKDKIKKVGGLYGLYLHYCYKLGYLPKYKKQNNARLHYLLKDDLINLDKLTDEVRLLGRNNISTSEQLFSYKETVGEKMKGLIDERDSLRKLSRRKISDDEMEKIKPEISKLTKEIGKLRKEMKTCDAIEGRSKKIENNLMIIEQEEKRKEKGRHEQRR